MVYKQKFGINFDGTEYDFEKKIHEAIESWEKRDLDMPFRYMEIGIEACKTLSAVYDILVAAKINFEIIGIDIEDWAKHYGQQAFQILPTHDCQIHYAAHKHMIDTRSRDKRVHLFLKDADEFLKNDWWGDVHFCFIDALHCECHVTSNFTNVEYFIYPEGIVAFHDCGPAEQGMDRQHDDHFIEVRQAIQKLGLWDGSRSGWKFLKESIGTRNMGLGQGNNIAFFERLV